MAQPFIPPPVSLPPPPVPAARTVPAVRPKISFWRRLGGGSLTISLLVHGLLLAAGLFWVLSVIPPEKEKIVDFTPSGGGGAPKSQSTRVQQQKIVRSAVQRIAAAGVSSSFTLPEPDVSSSISSLGALASSTGGLGGAGKSIGGGQGAGSGLGSGMGGGPVGKSNPFGMLGRNPGALVGTFYDLKQTDKKKPTEITNEATREVIKEFVNRGWKESSLSRKYYQAPQKLYQTKIYIPIMDAGGAPAAFNCEKEVQPSRWVIVYRGTVMPPKSGKYRFVGAGDDVLVVRFNNKHVFDHGFYGGTTGNYLSGNMVDILKGNDKTGREKEFRDSPMKIPVSYYQYDTTRNWNEAIGGLAVGPEFEAKAGTAYPIEILLSEIPGGSFCAALMIEQIGENYEKASTGAPILPLFRFDLSEPAKTSSDNAPPFDSKAAAWKIVESAPKIDF